MTGDKKSGARSAAARLAPDDWINAAIRRMVLGGVDNIRIQRLARDLRATKGSFYWHFRNRAALLDAILQRWRSGTVNKAHMLESEAPEASQRLLRLLHLPEETREIVPPPDFELAVRAWARHSARVARAVREVDVLRERMYVRMFRDLGAVGRPAKTLARICMAIAGRLWRWNALPAAERRDIIDCSHQWLISAARRKTRR
jgi:AcrR family transcriptional regulator